MKPQQEMSVAAHCAVLQGREEDAGRWLIHPGSPCFLVEGLKNIIRKSRGMFSHTSGEVRAVDGFLFSCLRGDPGAGG